MILLTWNNHNFVDSHITCLWFSYHISRSAAIIFWISCRFWGPWSGSCLFMSVQPSNLDSNMKFRFEIRVCLCHLNKNWTSTWNCDLKSQIHLKGRIWILSKWFFFRSWLITLHFIKLIRRNDKIKRRKVTLR